MDECRIRTINRGEVDVNLFTVERSLLNLQFHLSQQILSVQSSVTEGVNCIKQDVYSNGS